MARIGAARFKEQCLSILDHLGPEGVVITKHGRPVAHLLPYEQSPVHLIGCLMGKIEVKGDLLSTGLRSDADVEP